MDVRSPLETRKGTLQKCLAAFLPYCHFHVLHPPESPAIREISPYKLSTILSPVGQRPLQPFVSEQDKEMMEQ
ncbi:unnamed protein product, partial [Cyprideis torosa]